MSFTYTANIPVSGQTLNVTKNPINSNFQAINQLIAVNHVGFNLTGVGKHTKVEMPVMTTFTGTVGEGTLYAKTITAASNLMYTPDASGNQYQMTVVDSSNFATFGAAGIGWSFLPGGLIINYGFLNTPASTPPSGDITFSKPYTNASSINVYGTLYYTGSTPSGVDAFVTKIDTLTINQFHWRIIGNSNHIDGFSWFAIGI